MEACIEFFAEFMIGNIYVNLEVSINLENLHFAPNNRFIKFNKTLMGSYKLIEMT